MIRGAIRRTSTGSFLSLDPHISHDILDAIRREIANLPASAQKPVVITDMELRRFVRRMVELEFPALSVLSYQELAPELNVQPVGRITMRRPRRRRQLLPDAARPRPPGQELLRSALVCKRPRAPPLLLLSSACALLLCGCATGGDPPV